MPFQKNIALWVCLLLSCAGWGQRDTINRVINGLKQGLWIEKDTNVVGEIFTNHNNYLNGKLNGLCKTYDSKGTLLVSIQFKNGKKEGDYIVYSGNGKPMEIYTIINDTMYKHVQYINPMTGKIIDEVFYDETGKR